MGVTMHNRACWAPSVKFEFDGQRLLSGRGLGPSHPPLSIWSPPPGPDGDGWVHGVGIWSELDGQDASRSYLRLQGHDRLLTRFVIQDVLKRREQR